MARARIDRRKAYVDYREKEFTKARERKGELKLDEPFELEYGCEDSDDETEDEKDVDEDDYLPMRKQELAMHEFQLRREDPGTVFFAMSNTNRAMLDACRNGEVYVSEYPRKCDGCKCDKTDNICDFITLTAHLALPVVMPKDEVVRYFRRTLACGSWSVDEERNHYWAIPECIMLAIEANFELEEDLVEVKEESF
jgi:hypothetical protein